MWISEPKGAPCRIVRRRRHTGTWAFECVGGTALTAGDLGRRQPCGMDPFTDQNRTGPVGWIQLRGAAHELRCVVYWVMPHLGWGGGGSE